MSMVVIWKGRAFWPSMTRVASEMKLQFIVLLMKGKDREALRGVKPLRYAIDANLKFRKPQKQTLSQHPSTPFPRP